MDGLNRALGVGGIVHFDGRECQVRARTLEFDALVESEIVSRRGNPLDMIVQSVRGGGAGADLKPEQQEAIARAVVNAGKNYRNVTWQEHDDFVRTARGEAITIWWALRDNFDPGWGVDRVQFVLAESLRQAGRLGRLDEWVAWRDGLLRAIDIAGGEDVLGNLTGLRPRVAGAMNRQTGDSGSGDSTTSTEGSPPSSAS